MFATLAAEMRALDGTQPTFRQSPPMRWFSIKAHFRRDGAEGEGLETIIDKTTWVRFMMQV